MRSLGRSPPSGGAPKSQSKFAPIDTPLASCEFRSAPFPQKAGGFLAHRRFLLLQVLRPIEVEETSPQALIPGCPPVFLALSSMLIAAFTSRCNTVPQCEHL